jgi:hypothetical protein
MKNKIILSLLFISLFTIHSYSQRPGKGDRLLSFGIFNNTGFLAYKIYKDSARVTRFGVSGSANISNSGQGVSYSATSLTQSQTQNSNSSYNVGFFWGKQRSFFAFKRFEPYLGYDISVNLSYSYAYSKTTITDTAYVTTANTNNGYIYPNSNRNYIGDGTSYTNITPVALSASIIPFIGFNYFIFKNFALGAEYRLTVATLKYGLAGTNSTSTIFQGVETDYHAKILPSFSGAFSLTGAGFITASYYFR